MENKLSKNAKCLVRFITALVFSVGLLALSLTVKAAEPVYVVIEYLKVKPENHVKYLEVEQKIWKPMHQERINQGIIESWTLYAVEFTGSGNAYNYVAITTYSDPKNLENPWNAEIPAKVHGNMSLEEIMERTNKARDYYKSELYYSVASVPEIPLKDPAPYIQVNYMNVAPGNNSEYEATEKDIWMPIHQESIRTGKTVGWGFWAALIPRGAGRPYQYITVNTFSDYSYVFALDFSVPFKGIHPDKDYSEMLERTREVRTIVQTELWDLIDYVTK